MEFAAATTDDNHWKALNHQLLLCSKDDDTKVGVTMATKCTGLDATTSVSLKLSPVAIATTTLVTLLQLLYGNMYKLCD